MGWGGEREKRMAGAQTPNGVEKASWVGGGGDADGVIVVAFCSLSFPSRGIL